MRRRSVLIQVANLSVPSDRRVWNEAQTLVAAGWQVSVVCPKGGSRDNEAFVELDGVSIYRYEIKTRPPSTLGYITEFAIMLAKHARLAMRARRRHRFSVIHACNPPDLFFVIAAFYRLFGVRLVFDQHDADPEIFIVKFGLGTPLKRFLYRGVLLCERLTYMLADQVIAPNESYKKLALTRGHRSSDDVMVVRSGPLKHELDAARSAVGPDATVVGAAGGRDLGADAAGGSADHTIGYLGVMGVQDGVDLLLEAVALLVAERGKEYVRAELVGDGEVRPALERQAEALGVSANVTFHGFQPAAWFVAVLGSCDLCVAPDPPNEFNDISTMNKVIEYMAMDQPVVTFALHETVTIVGEAGVAAAGPTAADLAQAIAAVLDDDDRRAAMSRAATQIFADTLGWERSQPALLSVYERLAR